MDDLACDPIIAFYMKMSNAADTASEMPLFSETMLRLSFKEIFGAMRLIYPAELALYRKLLLLNFSERYSSINDLRAIMTCFDEHQLLEYLSSHREILLEWHTFLKNNIFHVIFKEALHELLYEYTVRHLALYGPITDMSLKQKAEEIQQFLRCGEKVPKQFYKSFRTLLCSRLDQAKFERYENLVEDDLDIRRIYADVKDRLNALAVQALEDKVGDDKRETTNIEPPAKRAKIDAGQSQVLTNNIAAKDGDDSGASDILYIDEINNVENVIPIANEPYLNDNDKSSDGCHADYSTENAPDEISIVNYANMPDEQIEIDEQIELIESDSESVIITKEYYENEKYVDEEQNTIAAAAITTSTEDDNAKQSSPFIRNQTAVIDYDTAISYLSALQAYAINNVHFEAISLLDEVDSMFRAKKNQSN